MKIKLQLLAFLFVLSAASFAQVGIGTTTPDASSALDISATDKGFLMPRMTTVQKTAITSPATGLQVYDTDTKSIWSFNGASWVEGTGGPGKFIDGASSDIAYYEDRVGIGRNDFSTLHKLYLETTKDAGQSQTAVIIDAIYEGTSAAGVNSGFAATARNTGTGTVTDAIGVQGIVRNSTGGTITTAIGSRPQLINSGTINWGAGLVVDNTNNAGLMRTSYGMNISVTNHSAANMGQSSLGSMYMLNDGTITGNAYGLWIGGAGGGSVGGNSYALYLATPYSNVGGNSFAIYSENTADSYINGNLGVGLEAPLRKVHISGALRLEPQDTPPAGGALGDLYVGADKKLYFHDGSNWRAVELAPVP
jgi:hypothetical protein